MIDPPIPTPHSNLPTPQNRRKSLLVLFSVAISVVGISVTFPIGWRLWNQNTALNTAYPYRFEKISSGSITHSLSQEIKFYQERISRNPEDGLDLAALAKVYLKMARATGDGNWYLLAEEKAKRSLANLPFNNHSAILALARVAEAKHEFTNSISLAEQVLKEKPKNEDALSILVTSNLAIGKVDVAAKAADNLVNQTYSIGSLTLRGLVNKAQGKDESALEDFQQALAAEEPGEAGSSAWARTMLGRFYFQRGKYQLAGKLYRESLRILPRYPLALVNLAELETRIGHYREAEKYYSQVFVSPAYPNVFDHVALHGLARVKKLEGDEAGAKIEWQKAEALLRQHLTVNSFGHRRELARLLLETGESKHIAEALSLMEAEVKIRRDSETLDTLAWALVSANRWEEAQEAMEEALRWGIRDAAIFYRAGNIAEKLGDKQQAISYFQLAQKTNSAFDAQARQTLGLGLDF